MQRLFALSIVLLASACSDTSTLPTRPDLVAFNAECYEAEASPAADSRICAFQDGLPAEIHDDTAMGRLIVECDPTKVAIEFRRQDSEEFQQLTCGARIEVELICNWTTTLRITATDFGHGTTNVVIRSDCPIPDYAGVQCDDSVPPHANFGSTEGHCAVGDTFVIDNIAAGDELEAWADPID